ncbi:phosphatase PAP2 family protein [Microbacterium sp.]|uniref:phosphatase PAP2 family protein n=1 Tax=Microbacterium sp. TaxID=51671 RepID=UPI003A923C8E
MDALPSWPGTRRSLRIAVIASLIGLAAAVVVGVAVHGSDAGIGFDLWLNSLHSPAWDAIARAVAVGFQPTSAVVIGAALAVIVAVRLRRVLPGLAAGAAVAIGWLCTGVLKIVIDRPRPVWTDAVHQVVAPETDGSYPSGHTAFATALVVTIVLLVWRTRARWWALVGGSTLVVITAFARMYVVVHYPIDVIAGAGCAVCGVVLAFAVFDVIARRFTVPAPTLASDRTPVRTRTARR